MKTEQLENWLIEKLSQELDIPADDINTETPFANYGMDSAMAIALSGELAELLGKKIEPTIVFDHPTVEALASFLSEEDVI